MTTADPAKGDNKTRGRSKREPALEGGSERNADTGRAGIVLAGGRSKRFPTVDKAVAPLDGTPLLRHAVSTLEPAVDQLIINCRKDQREPFAEVLREFDVWFVFDSIPDRGPLVGLETALSATGATYAAVLSCDMPLVPAAFVDVLFSRARNRTGAVAQLDGQPQPFPAVVHVRAAEAACTEAAQRNTSRLDEFISILDPVVLPERAVLAHVDRRAFTDINTHEDLATARNDLLQTKQ